MNFTSMSLFKPEGSARNSLVLKLIAITVLVLIFMIPVATLHGLIQERQFRQQGAAQEVGSSWGRPQTVIGPFLAIPYHPLDAQQRVNFEITHTAYFLPETIDVDGTITTQIRSRGIYDVPVYETELKLKGNFAAPDISPLGLGPNQMVWNQSRLMLGVPDLRGISEAIPLQWRGETKTFQPGVIGTVVPSGVSTLVPLAVNSTTQNAMSNTDYAFSVDLKLRGSEHLMFAPIGKTMTVDLVGDWPAPSFAGAFLPTEREVKDDGFSANWKVLDLNRSTPQAWKSEEVVAFGFAYPTSPDTRYDPYGKGMMLQQEGGDTFGVRLFLPVDIYQKSMRSAKYGIAVIALVFVVIFFIEMAAKRRIHPVQYALIGLSLIVYYTLLLSLAEHIRFGLAYLIASVATIGLITLFIRSIMESTSRAFLTGGVLTVFYGFIYILLQLEDYALLLGSLALFGILAMIMYLSRRIDWYGVDGDTKK